MSDAHLETRRLAVKAAKLFDPTRIEILLTLRERDRSGRELCEATGLGRTTIQKQLGIVRAAELVGEVHRSNPPRYELTPRGRKTLAGLDMIAQA